MASDLFLKLSKWQACGIENFGRLSGVRNTPRPLRCQCQRVFTCCCLGSALQGDFDAMSASQAAWEDLPLGVQQRILVLTGNRCARRVSKDWRNAFDSAADTLSYSHTPHVAATAAVMRVAKNSTSLTAVNRGHRASLPLLLSDVLAAGATSGLATRLRKLTGVEVTAACADQQAQALRQCTSLTHLDIRGCSLPDFLTEDLAAALQAMPRLTRLHFCQFNLQSQHVVCAFASALQHLTQLQHLHLARSNLGNAGLVALAPALSAIPGLQTLDVNNNSVSGAEGAKALYTLLDPVPGLTHLDVSCCRWLDEAAALLAMAVVLRGLTRLQTLNMGCTKLGVRGVATLAPALAVLPHLHTLDLSSNRFGAGAVSVLQPVLAREGSPLHKLNLSSYGIMHGAHALAAGLSTATQLRELTLDDTLLGNEGWIALAQGLSQLGPSLQSLQLCPDSLDDAGTGALALALKALTRLTHLQAACSFNSAHMVTVSSALMGMRLQVLRLHGHSMSAESTAAFAAVLPALAGSLVHLTLTSSRIDVEAAANALAPALAQATNLVELYFGSNDFGPQGAQWLVPVLNALPHLRKISLQCCRLGVHGCMAMARALKDRDGAVVFLAHNGVARDSTEGCELCNMAGVSIYV